MFANLIQSITKPGGPHPNKANDDIAAAEKSIKNTLIFGILIGGIGLVGFPLQIAGVGLNLMFISLMISCASFMSGFFVGILFGIPKRNNGGNGDYTLNNSLVEIADWLTKIIVGLGLVNIKQIPTMLLGIGKYVQAETNLTGTSISVFTMSIIVFYSVFGLYIGYNYMRLVLSGKYKDADDNLIEQLVQAKQELNKKQNEVVEVKQANVALLDKMNEPQKLIEEVKEAVFKNFSADKKDGNTKASMNFVDSMIKTANDKLKDGLIKNKQIDDPQKGMWGGKSEEGKRKLVAEVNEMAKSLYHITLRVESTDAVNSPLDADDVVLFSLHNTWKPPYRLINVEKGVAQLELYSYGSFTIGAICDKGKTHLELDLADLPDVPHAFRIL